MEKRFKIALGADHAGYAYKEAIKAMLNERDVVVIDYGTDSEESVDYPDHVHPVAEAVEEHDADFGILVCGSANGVAMAANKHRDIRAAIAWAPDVARLAREHNDANVLCLPARFVELKLAKEMVEVFLETGFEGGRHLRRVNKIANSKY